MPGREGDVLVLSKAESHFIAAEHRSAQATEHFAKLGH
jgi:hypothetical protein